MAPAPTADHPTETDHPRAAAPPSHEPDKSFLLVPYGDYRGTAPSVTAKLTLSADHTFVLVWTDRGNAQQGQWTGKFEWKKGRIGESLNVWDVEEAIDARRGDERRSHTLAVTHLDRDASSFALPVTSLGTVDFTPIK